VEEAMIAIAIGANADHRDFALYAKASAEAFGYKVVLYDLGGLGEGRKIEVVRPNDFERRKNKIIRALFKTEVVRRTLEDYEKVVMIDTDCIIKRPIDEAFEDDFHIGLTLRPRPPISLEKRISQQELERLPEEKRYRLGCFNSGVMFFQQKEQTFNLIKAWEELAQDAETESDQAGMNRLVSPHMDYDPRTDGPEAPKFVDIPGGRVRVFCMTEYNYTPGGKLMPALEIIKPLPPPKVIHYKNQKAVLKKLAADHRRRL
jgi:hypothetical protein